MAFQPDPLWKEDLPDEGNEFNLGAASGRANIKSTIQAFVFAVLSGCNPGATEEEWVRSWSIFCHKKDVAKLTVACFASQTNSNVLLDNKNTRNYRRLFRSYNAEVTNFLRLLQGPDDTPATVAQRVRSYSSKNLFYTASDIKEGKLVKLIEQYRAKTTPQLMAIPAFTGKRKTDTNESRPKVAVALKCLVSQMQKGVKDGEVKKKDLKGVKGYRELVHDLGWVSPKKRKHKTKKSKKSKSSKKKKKDSSSSSSSSDSSSSSSDSSEFDSSSSESGEKKGEVLSASCIDPKVVA